MKKSHRCLLDEIEIVGNELMQVLDRRVQKQ